MLDPKEKETIFENSIHNPETYYIPPLIKETDKRGFMYIVKDTAYPTVFKIGRTNNPVVRIKKYNSDKPFKTASFHLISKPFKDVHMIEDIILENIYEKSEATALTREWFPIEYLEFAISWIKLAEEKAHLL